MEVEGEVVRRWEWGSELEVWSRLGLWKSMSG